MELQQNVLICSGCGQRVNKGRVNVAQSLKLLTTLELHRVCSPLDVVVATTAWEAIWRD
jgi:hypothetical protein